MGVIRQFGMIAALGVVASPALAQSLADNFENGTNGWSFQQLTPSARWNIDNQPAVFVSPQNTLNNIDQLAGIMESGSGTAISPNASFIGPGNRVLQFRCRYEIVDDQDTFRRELQVGSGLIGGVLHVSFLFDSLQSLNDNVIPAPGQFVVTCSASDWHLHTIRAQEDTANLIVDGNNVPNSEAERDALFNATSLNLVYSYTWGETQTLPGPVTVYGIIAWLIDDLILSIDLNDPFAPDTNSPASGNRGGGSGGSSSGCSSTSGRAPGPPVALFMAVVGLAAFALKKKFSFGTVPKATNNTEGAS